MLETVDRALSGIVIGTTTGWTLLQRHGMVRERPHTPLCLTCVCFVDLVSCLAMLSSVALALQWEFYLGAATGPQFLILPERLTSAYSCISLKAGGGISITDTWTMSAMPPMTPVPTAPTYKPQPAAWAHLAHYDSTYDCSGGNNTKIKGCAAMDPQKTLLDCQEYCARTVTPAGTNCTVFAFQEGAKPNKNGLKGCWFRWGSSVEWKDPMDCSPPLHHGCNPSGDTSGCRVGKVKGCKTD